jgi:hypothetical protein
LSFFLNSHIVFVKACANDNALEEIQALLSTAADCIQHLLANCKKLLANLLQKILTNWAFCRWFPSPLCDIYKRIANPSAECKGALNTFCR